MCSVLQVGSHYLADGWGLRMMTLSDFMSTHVYGQEAQGGIMPASAGVGHAPAWAHAGTHAGTHAPALLPIGGQGAGKGEGQRPEPLHQARGSEGEEGHKDAQQPQSSVGYLAQHPLFEQVGQLGAIMSFLSYLNPQKPVIITVGINTLLDMLGLPDPPQAACCEVQRIPTCGLACQ